MAAVGRPILFSPLELNLDFSNLPFPPLGPGFSLRGVGGNQESTRLGLSAAPPSPSPAKAKTRKELAAPGGQAGITAAGLFSALGPAVCQIGAVQHKRLGPGLHSAPLLPSGLLSHNPSHQIGSHHGGLGGPPPPAWSLWKQDKSTASCLLLSFPLSQRLAPGVSGELCCREPVRLGGAEDDGPPSRGLYFTGMSASHTSPHRTRVSHCSHTTPEWGHYTQAKRSSKRGFLVIRWLRLPAPTAGGGMDSTPRQGTEILRAPRCNQKKRTSEIS